MKTIFTPNSNSHSTLPSSNQPTDYLEICNFLISNKVIYREISDQTYPQTQSLLTYLATLHESAITSFLLLATQKHDLTDCFFLVRRLLTIEKTQYHWSHGFYFLLGLYQFLISCLTDQHKLNHTQRKDLTFLYRHLSRLALNYGPDSSEVALCYQLVKEIQRFLPDYVAYPHHSERSSSNVNWFMQIWQWSQVYQNDWCKNI